MDSFLTDISALGEFAIVRKDPGRIFTRARVNILAWQNVFEQHLRAVLSTDEKLIARFHSVRANAVRDIGLAATALSKVAARMLWVRLREICSIALPSELNTLYAPRVPINRRFELPMGIVNLINTIGLTDIVDNLIPVKILPVWDGENAAHYGFANANFLDSTAYRDAELLISEMKAAGYATGAIDTRTASGSAWWTLMREDHGNEGTYITAPFPKDNYSHPRDTMLRASFPVVVEWNTAVRPFIELVGWKWAYDVRQNAVHNFIPNAPYEMGEGHLDIPETDFRIVGGALKISDHGISAPTGPAPNNQQQLAILGAGDANDRAWIYSFARGIAPTTVREFLKHWYHAAAPSKDVQIAAHSQPSGV